MNKFLRSTAVIDCENPAVAAVAWALRGDRVDTEAIAKRCFEWVRDEIKHSADFALTAVTCTASEVLEEGSGYCYAKSHLLAALLRANGIPAGLCYQRLALDDDGRRFSLHGFNAVHLPAVGWYRIDPRGNRPGIDAQFVPPVEKLAFSPALPGEVDLPEIWTDPIPIVVEALRSYRHTSALAEHLPDVVLRA
jgi:transglutaminase-like putative cysteine protease